MRYQRAAGDEAIVGETMSEEVELVSDGEGLAVIGDQAAVERFIESNGLVPLAKSRNLGASLSAAAGVAQAASGIAANSGRWLRITKESAEKIKQIGLTPTDTPGISHAMLGTRGDIKGWLQVVSKPGSILTNPAALAGAAGIMAQMAMQQQMQAITDYLAVIDEKLDDVLRAHTNQVLAKLDGVDLAIKEAMTVRDSVGGVSEINWSKVQHQSEMILETQAYALRQLSDLADKLERETKAGPLADTAAEAAPEVRRWLTVLARCVRLHEAMGVLELDRVLAAAPEELDRHRLGLQIARRERLDLLAQTTSSLIERMDVAVGTANAKALLHPTVPKTVVNARNDVATEVNEFRGLLGIESSAAGSYEPRRWRDAASERLDEARAAGAAGIETVKGAGGKAWDGARSLGDTVSEEIVDRARRRGREDE